MAEDETQGGAVASRDAPGRREFGIDRILGPGVRSVLIKGLPGTGKTTLALELLKIARGGLYISTRVSEATLIEQMPSIGDQMSGGKLKKGRKIRFEDLRQGKTSDIERLFNQKNSGREALTVIDSWDAFASELDDVERLRIEKAIVTKADATRSRIIFVGEETALTPLEYLVDAVITLKNDVMQGKFVRRIEWNKLRGMGIPQVSYLFTLYGESFTMFQRTSAEPPENYEPRAFNPVEHSERFYSVRPQSMLYHQEYGWESGFPKVKLVPLC